MSGQDRTQPREGRCNARLGGGRFCHAKPKAGTSRCAIHGGTQQKWAMRQRALTTAAQDEVQAAIDDPDLLDVRRPIALAEVVVSRTPLVASDEEIEQLARRRVLSRMSPAQLKALVEAGPDGLDLLKPTDADRDDVRLERHERSMRIVSVYALRQAQAVQQLEWSRVIRETTMPLLFEFGLEMTRILRKYLPEDQVAACMEEARRAMATVIGRLSQHRDAVK